MTSIDKFLLCTAFSFCFSLNDVSCRPRVMRNRFRIMISWVMVVLTCKVIKFLSRIPTITLDTYVIVIFSDTKITNVKWTSFDS